MEEALRIDTIQKTICRMCYIIMWMMAGIFLFYEISAFAACPDLSWHLSMKILDEATCRGIDMSVLHTNSDIRGISEKARNMAAIQQEKMKNIVQETPEAERIRETTEMVKTLEVPVIRDEEMADALEKEPAYIENIPDSIPDDLPQMEIPGAEIEIRGFLIDADGYITGYTDAVSVADGVLVIPSDERCTGIRRSALEGLESMIFEIYIPENITEIEAESFEHLHELMYIEVAADNPVYISEYGVLYMKNGELIAFPRGRY
ncbi:MAG: hypothetical protein ACI4V6_04250 [Dorea sp.]